MHPQSPEPTPPEAEALLDAEATAEMERALSALPLHEPSTALDARVAVALADASTASTDEAAAMTAATPAAIPFPGAMPRRSRWLTGLAAAAVVALLAALGLTIYLQPGGASSPGGPGVAENGTQPVIPQVGPDASDDMNTTNAPEVVRAGYNFQEEPVQLYWTRDLDAGTLTAENTQPVRAVRRQDVEQRVWVDPERGVTVQVTRPRERLMVVKQPTF